MASSSRVKRTVYLHLMPLLNVFGCVASFKVNVLMPWYLIKYRDVFTSCFLYPEILPCWKYRMSHSLPNPAFLNNSNTNEDIATRFEQEYVRCVRNEEKCVCSAPSCCDTEQRSARQPACILPDAPLCWSLCIWLRVPTQYGGFSWVLV
jgi:hypothetical protein